MHCLRISRTAFSRRSRRSPCQREAFWAKQFSATAHPQKESKLRVLELAGFARRYRPGYLFDLASDNHPVAGKWPNSAHSLINLPSLINNVLTAPTPDTSLLQALVKNAASQQDFSSALTGATELAGLHTNAQNNANSVR
jgi:hypothetical protein